MYSKLYAKNFGITLNVRQLDKKVKPKSAFFNFIQSFSNRRSFDLSNNPNAVKEFKKTLYYKLPYIGSFSNNTQKKIKELCKKFCKNSNINIAFSPFKTGDLFSNKDCLPSRLKSLVVCKFVCAGCQSCYIGETEHHLPTRINEHLVTDKKSHIFKHLLENSACKNLCDENCFTIIDSASSPFRLKLKEALHIAWLKPNLNKQKEHVSIIILV